MTPPAIILATTNPGKVREMQALLGPCGGLVVQGLPAAGIKAGTEIEETGSTFAENALIKGRTYCRLLSQPVLAEDSGLEVDALGGEPGVRSARWIPGSDGDRVRHLLTRLTGVPWELRTARYTSVIALCWPDGREQVFAGSCEGRIAFQERGSGGFGYDPVFVTTSGQTVAELSMAEKNAISHRARAVAQALPVLLRCLAS